VIRTIPTSFYVKKKRQVGLEADKVLETDVIVEHVGKKIIVQTGGIWDQSCERSSSSLCYLLRHRGIVALLEYIKVIRDQQFVATFLS
jgi:hypothetical protein